MTRRITIGPELGRITGINADRIDFVDQAGAEGSASLKREPGEVAPGLSPMYVAIRKLDQPPWLVLLRDAAQTEFEFVTPEAAYDELLNALHALGRRTYDST